MAYTVQTAMAEALKNLQNVEDHLRKNQQSPAANEIGKLSAKIAQTVNEALLYISQGTDVNDIEQHTNATTANPSVSRHEVKQHVSGGQHAMTNHGSPILREVYQALEYVVQKEQNKLANRPAHFEGLTLQTLPQAPMPAVQPHSYAQVAGSTTSGPPHGVAQLFSSKSMTSFSGSKVGQSSDDSGSIGDLMTFSSSPASERPEEKAGIIRVHGQMDEKSLAHFTSCIWEGPLQEVLIEAQNRARIVFQHLSHARAFYQSNQDLVNEVGYGRFGAAYHVEMADIAPWNDNHRLMNQPFRQRRRLSFAKKGLFSYHRRSAHGTLIREDWERHMRAIAGSGNIERLFVFNSGNATAIFTSTVVARKVLETVNQWARTKAAYRGVAVSYSSDPCEKELVLTDDKCIFGHDNGPNHDRNGNFNRNLRGGPANMRRGNHNFMPPRHR
ncbi:hypothetical protein BDW74DRAFT_176898 [Aspergillus multicolor]|uniref:uncharacterized protein n=1 Tax=Aspergillus multicolor TaxID=41759 RepID=UPI003CCCD0BB